MQLEISALENNHIWKIMPKPPNQHIVDCKWLFKIKYRPDGIVDRYKAMLVAKGFTQTYGLDYIETYAPVAKMTTVRLLIAIVASQYWPISQLDITNALLHGDLNETVYMRLPPGYLQLSTCFDLSSITDPNTVVCKLKKSLYGLKQAPRCWFSKFSDALLDYGCTQSHSDNSSDKMLIKSVIAFLSTKFKAKDLGSLRYFLVQVLSQFLATPRSDHLQAAHKVIRSSAEAEYRSMADTCCEVTWLLNLFKAFGISTLTPVTLFYDNKSAIYIASNVVFHERTKHIEIDCHLIREKIKLGMIRPAHINTTMQPADIFTKALPSALLLQFSSNLGLCNLFSPPNLWGDVTTTNSSGTRRNLVKRCEGLPLAISSLGGLLRGKLLTEWETIYNFVSLFFANGEGLINDGTCYTVTQILGLSYDSLPPRLAHCFLCFANYKENEEIGTEELYMFWIAEGLISVEDRAAGEMMVDVAEHYLDELAQRRKIINIVHLPWKPDYEFKARIVRRLCMRLDDDWDESMLKPYDHHVISHIRSLLVFNATFDTVRVWPDKILSLEKFKLLRVLTVSRYKLTRQDMRSISELFYLKCLCLRYCIFEELPSSIGNLRYLQTLDLRSRYPITVPNVLWKLKQLKHLYLPRYFKVGVIEELRFEGLDELEMIYNYDSDFCNSQDLIQLSKLKVFAGKIKVEDNLAENLIDFINSRELRHSSLEIEGEAGGLCLASFLECCFIDLLKVSTRICLSPEKYDLTRFSGRLIELRLEYCRIEEDLMGLLEKLPNLRLLYLCEDAFLGAEMVCTATGFPQLRKLGLQNLHGLKKWRMDEGAMPNLCSLEVDHCRNLEMFPRELRYLTALKSLYIAAMPATFENRIKVTDGAEGEDFYKVRHIPTIILD
ncbi:hypothetical protein AgCh_022686 [Apium graveolens]